MKEERVKKEEIAENIERHRPNSLTRTDRKLCDGRQDLAEVVLL